MVSLFCPTPGAGSLPFGSKAPFLGSFGAKRKQNFPQPYQLWPSKSYSFPGKAKIDLSLGFRIVHPSSSLWSYFSPPSHQGTMKTKWTGHTTFGGSSDSRCGLSQDSCYQGGISVRKQITPVCLDQVFTKKRTTNGDMWLYTKMSQLCPRSMK